MVESSDWLHYSFPKFQIKAKFLHYFYSCYDFLLDSSSLTFKPFSSELTSAEFLRTSWITSLSVRIFWPTIHSQSQCIHLRQGRCQLCYCSLFSRNQLSRSWLCLINLLLILQKDCHRQPSAMTLAATCSDTPHLQKQFVKILSRSVIQALKSNIMPDKMDISNIKAFFSFFFSIVLPPMTNILSLKHKLSLSPLAA